MANIDVGWEVEGILTPQESVEKMLAVIPTKTMQDTGTFWTWEGKVSSISLLHPWSIVSRCTRSLAYSG